MLAGDSLRLFVLLVRLRRDDNRITKEFGWPGIPYLGNRASLWSRDELPDHRTRAAFSCYGTSRTVSGNLAGKSGKQAVQPASVCRSIHRIHYPPVFFAVCSPLLC